MTQYKSTYIEFVTLLLPASVDPLPPDIRLAMEKLDDLEYSKLPKQEYLLEQLELEIEVASLNSVDDDVTTHPSPLRQQQTNPNTTSSGTLNNYGGGVHVSGKTKQNIAILSSKLDDLVAAIDSIASLQSHELKQRKKELSNVAVKLLERIDILISKVDHQ